MPTRQWVMNNSLVAIYFGAHPNQILGTSFRPLLTNISEFKSIRIPISKSFSLLWDITYASALEGLAETLLYKLNDEYKPAKYSG